MKYYNITVNGKVYQVAAEEVSAPTAAPVAAPAPAAAPVAVAAPAAAPAPAVEAAPAAPAAPKAAAPAPGAAGVMTAPMPGTIANLSVSVGQAVTAGQVVLVLEAMKMENEIFAASTGTVSAIFVNKGDTVNSGDPMIQID